MKKVKFTLYGAFSVLLMAVLLLGTVPAQAQTQPPNATPIPEGVSEDDWAQINALLPEAIPYSQQAYLKASNTGADDNFGSALAVSGNTVVVGTRLEDSNATGVNGDQTNSLAPDSGAVYVFVRNGNTWSQQAYLKASNTESKDWFGSAVAIYGNTLVVGAPGEDSAATGVNGDQSDNSASYFGWSVGAGAAYVFTRTGSTWSQQAYLKQSNTEAGDAFGTSVAISADTIAVGAHYEDSAARGLNGDQNNNDAIDSGAAYIFTRSNGVWSQQVYVKSSPLHEASDEWYDNFGQAMAMSGNTLVIGEPGAFVDVAVGGMSNCGVAYVFVRENGVWSEQIRLRQSADYCVGGNAFGSSMAISGNTLVIGAYGENSAATGVNGDENDYSLRGAGAAYVFVRNGTTWPQQAYLKASNTDADDNFGRSVAIFGDRIVVGASGEDSAATGWNGQQNISGASNSGAVYIFGRIGTTWSQHAYLKASNTNKDDSFGDRVAISGNNMILIGAPYESSNAMGVNGDQGNNLASRSGALYSVVTSPLPNVIYSTRVGASPSTEASVDFNVAFSTAVTGVDKSDFIAATDGISGAKVTNVTGGPSTYTVTMSTGSGSGTIRLNVRDDDSIVDSKNIPLGGVGATNGNFYWGETYVMRPLTRMFRSQAAQDGWILESGGFTGFGNQTNSTNSTFIVGSDKSNREYRSILHFSTGDLPDTAVVTKVMLRIKKHSEVIYVFQNGTHIDLSAPRFGTGMNLQSGDFEAAPSVPSIVGVLDENPVGDIYSATFFANRTATLNLTGPTQLRLRVLVAQQNHNRDSYIRFYSGDAVTSADRPTLVVEYYVP